MRPGRISLKYYRQKPRLDPDTEGGRVGVQADGKGVGMIAGEKPDAPKEQKARRGKGEKRGGLRRMAGKQVAFQELAERVSKRDPSGEKKIVIFLDGEKALEDQIRSIFAQAGLAERIEAIVLDIMHVMEYLWEAPTRFMVRRAKNAIPG